MKAIPKKSAAIALTLSLALTLPGVYAFADKVTPQTPAAPATTPAAPAPTLQIPQHQSGLYPLRPIIEKLGATITWDANTQSITIQSPTAKLTIDPKHHKVHINDIPTIAKYDIKLIEGTTYVSSDFIAHALDLAATKDPKTAQLILAAWPQSLETPQETLTAQEQTMRTTLASYFTAAEINTQFSGQVLVAKGDKVLLHRGYGMANREKQVENTTESTYAIGSTTKQFTAAAIIQLAEQKKLAFTDLVSKHLPNAPYGDKITIEQLLMHTSGLYNYTDALQDPAQQELSKCTPDLIDKMIKANPLKFTPGSQFSYSNTNYYMLGQVVATITKKPLETYFKDQLFIQADMKTAAIAVENGKSNLNTLGYSGDTPMPLPGSLEDTLLQVAAGAGNISATTADLYHWNKALLANKIVSQDNYNRMSGQHPDFKQNPNLTPEGGYGYGLMYSKTPAGLIVHHGGNTLSYTAYNAIIPQNQMQVIILSNKGYVTMDPMANSGFTALFGGQVENPQAKTFITRTEAELKQLVGTYNIAQVGLDIEIRVEKGILMLQGKGQPAIPMTPVTSKEYFSKEVGITIIFDGEKAPKSFKMLQGGAEFEALKK